MNLFEINPNENQNTIKDIFWEPNETEDLNETNSEGDEQTYFDASSKNDKILIENLNDEITTSNENSKESLVDKNILDTPHPLTSLNAFSQQKNPLHSIAKQKEKPKRKKRKKENDLHFDENSSPHFQVQIIKQRRTKNYGFLLKK
ncbi:hypothetical protein M0811_07571 [Anaeramoeba ignava]|uniref:Uncharacterized protein n=1 Tax=Anaeramoeba ignava TaxID=1746090 RepID=A0A9Q0LPM9_ANAIG|nr:hypothetical protein M0811_07571 [Anaeramoeba ignava]